MVHKSRYLKQKLVGIKSILNFPYTSHYKTYWHIVWSAKKQKKNKTGNINSKVLKTKNGKTVLSSKCAVCGSKVPRFMKEQESSGILSSLGLKTTLSKIPFYNDVFF